MDYGDEGEGNNSESEVGEGNDSYTTGNYVQTNDEDNDDDNASFHDNNNGNSDNEEDQEASTEQYRCRKKRNVSDVTTAKVSQKGKGGTAKSKKVKKIT